MKLNVIQTNCDCKDCSSMCKSPCNGTPKDIRALIKAGYADRLMFDDLPSVQNVDLIKPALKGYEGKRSPWETRSKEGCTFWKDGKCEIHNLGLKPIQGKLANHANSLDTQLEICDYIVKTWETKSAENVINLWKKEVGYIDYDDNILNIFKLFDLEI